MKKLIPFVITMLLAIPAQAHNAKHICIDGIVYLEYFNNMGNNYLQVYDKNGGMMLCRRLNDIKYDDEYYKKRKKCNTQPDSDDTDDTQFSNLFE